MIENAKPDRSAPVVIVGGGVMGATIGLALARRGRGVTIVDPDPGPTGASIGNAGHIAVEQVDPLASFDTLRTLPHRLAMRGGPVAFPPRAVHHWLPFGLRLIAAARPARFAAGRAALGGLLGEALPAWRRLASWLNDCGLIIEDGHFVLWESEATAAAGTAAYASGTPAHIDVRSATYEELASIGDRLRARPVGGVRIRGTARLSGHRRLFDRLAASFAAAGGTRIAARVERINTGCVLLEGGRRLPAGLIVVAAGARSAKLVTPLGHSAPLIAERGYHVEADAPDWPTDLPAMYFEDRSVIVNRLESGLRATSFVEFASPDLPANPKRWDRLEAHARALGLPIGSDEPARRWMGSRPTLPDYLPAIGVSRRHPGLIYAFGHQHLGLTLAPITAELVAALASGETPAVPLDRFDLARFD